MTGLPVLRLGPGLAASVSPFVLMVCPPPSLAQEGGEALKQRFLREAPSQWEKYVRLSGALQGVLSTSDTDSRSFSRKGVREDHGLTIQMEYKTNGRGTLLKAVFKKNRDGKVEEREEIFGFTDRRAKVVKVSHC